MDVLTSITVWAVALDEISFAGFSFITGLKVSLLLQFLLAVGEATFITKVTMSSQVISLA